MNDKQWEQITRQIPNGEKVIRTYRAFEGDFRVITETANGMQKRYTVSTDKDGNATITEM